MTTTHVADCWPHCLMANLRADVRSYYIEELVEIFPSCVVYLQEDELYFNSDRVFDTMVGAMQSETTAELREFNRMLHSLVEELVEKGLLNRTCLHTRPPAAADDRTACFCFRHASCSQITIF